VAVTALTPTMKDVQWLADHPRGEGMVVSCYADFSVSSGVRPLWRQYLKNEVKRIEETCADRSAARQFHSNVTAIEAALSSRRLVAARGIAVFAASQRNLLQTYALASPVPNRLVVDEGPYLVPLLEVLHRQRRYLVVHTDTQRACLYTAVPGAVRLIEEISAGIPKRHRAAGERWGWQQATIARHREDHILHYLNDLAREIERAWPSERYDGIILSGEHEVLQELRTHLPDLLGNQIVGEAPHAWVGKQASLVSKIDTIHAEALRRHGRQVLEELKRRLMEQHRIALGPQAVIDAIRNDEVGYRGRVVMEPDRGEVASRCTVCASLFARVVEECPSCRRRCDKTNLWQAIALRAARQHVSVDFVESGQGLEKHGGVVALLAHEAVSMPPPEPALATSVKHRAAPPPEQRG
jgi:peptide subunit release factor 1 (eRF1)